MALVESHIEAGSSSPFVASELTREKRLSLKNVLFATDFSIVSDAAFPYATAICRHFGSLLHVAHVLSETSVLLMTGGVDYVSLSTIYEDAHTEAKEKLDQISARLQGIPHRSYVRHGDVWENLQRIIHENDIELIVLGTHGRSGLGRLLLGSVAENILRHAQCPVLTIGPNVEGRAKLLERPNRGRDLAPLELELRQVLFATNFATNSARIADQAVALAEEFGSQLTLLHVIEDYRDLGSRPGPIEEGIRRLHELIPKDAALSYTPETLLEFGSAAERILAAADEREADIIVLGARPSEEVGPTRFPWSTACHVIAGAHCPVLTLRG